MSTKIIIFIYYLAKNIIKIYVRLIIEELPAKIVISIQKSL